MSTSFHRALLAFIVFAQVPLASFAEAGCLEQFSCHLNGECRLPCLPGSPDQAPAQQAQATPPKASDASAVAMDDPTPALIDPKPKPVHKRVAAVKPRRVEIHILASRDIKTIADLNQTVVSFGPQNSAGERAAKEAVSALGVKIADTPLDLSNAMDGLATGDIAAVIVADQDGSKRLKQIAGSGVHLLSIPETADPPNGMRRVTIAAATYPGLTDHDVSTFEVVNEPVKTHRSAAIESSAR